MLIQSGNHRMERVLNLQLFLRITLWDWYSYSCLAVLSRLKKKHGSYMLESRSCFNNSKQDLKLAVVHAQPFFASKLTLINPG